MGRKFIIDDKKFHRVIFWKVWTNWENVGLHNSKLYWNCTIWRFIRRKQDLIRYKMGRKFIIDDKIFHRVIFWKVCTNWENVGLHNSKLYWNCTIWRFIRRKQDLIRYKMGRHFIIDDKNSIGWYSGKSVQTEKTWVCATQNCIEIVRDGKFFRKIIDAQLSEIEDDGGEKYRSEITKLWRWARENRNRCSGQESKGISRRWKRKRYLLPVERKSRTTLWAIIFKTRGRSMSRKKSVRGRSQSEKFNRPPCKYFLKGPCTKPLCESLEGWRTT